MNTNTSETNKPLATFGLLSYNQKQYLEKALGCAAAQTYRPLEIVVSDDGSQDGSWDMICSWRDRMAKEHPDVAIVLNRNEPNLGILGNWQRVMGLSHGEIIVKADGDDLSHPERTAKMMAAWEKSDRKAAALFSEGYVIDTHDHILGVLPAPGYFCPVGALSAWAKRTYSDFGAVTNHLRVTDDVVYGFRAQVVGTDAQCHEPLVAYRQGTGISTSLFSIRNWYVAKARVCTPAYDQVEEDLAFCRARIGGDLFLALSRQLESRRNSDAIILAMCTAKSLQERLAAKKHLDEITPCRPLSIPAIQRWCLVLPYKIGDVFLFAYSVTKYLLKRWLFRNVRLDWGL